MDFQKLSKKYNIGIEIIKKELFPIAQEEAEAMGKGNDTSYIFQILEELCEGYLVENSYGSKYKSLFDTESRYKPIFGDSIQYKSVMDDGELEEEIEGVMSTDGVQSTDFDTNMLPEYPVGMTVDQVNKKKKEYN
jgi:hypothetical protein